MSTIYTHQFNTKSIILSTLLLCTATPIKAQLPIKCETIDKITTSIYQMAKDDSNRIAQISFLKSILEIQKNIWYCKSTNIIIGLIPPEIIAIISEKTDEGGGAGDSYGRGQRME